MTPQELASRLFFIVGCGRSGTTLLKSMLAAHPGVYLPPETFFFSSVRPRFPGAAQAAVDERLRYICSRWWMRDAGLDRAELERQLEFADQSAERDSPDWHAMFLASLSALTPAGEWLAIGEKTPAHVLVAEELLDAFPECRVIQVVRDPRAVLSSYRKVKVGTNEAVAVAREWMAATEVHRRLREHPRATQVHYESMVTEPESVLRGLCEHLRIPFDPEMMRFHERSDAGYAAEQTHHAATRRPVFQDRMQAWRKELPPQQLAMLEARLGNRLADFGYEPSQGLPKVGSFALRMSHWRDQMHRVTVRRGRQYMKRRRALNRIAQNQGAGD